MRRETIRALEVRKNSVMAERRKSQMQTLGANNEYGVVTNVSQMLKYFGILNGTSMDQLKDPSSFEQVTNFDLPFFSKWSLMDSQCLVCIDLLMLFQ